MTPTDKVRAALEHAKSCARNEYSMYVYEEALSELEGCVIISLDEYNKLVQNS